MKATQDTPNIDSYTSDQWLKPPAVQDTLLSLQHGENPAIVNNVLNLAENL